MPIRTLRPLQLTKNGVLLAALVFVQRLFEPDALLRTIVGALVFCGLSSAIYLINDVRDIEAAGLHPTKRPRAPEVLMVRDQPLFLTIVVWSVSSVVIRYR